MSTVQLHTYLIGKTAKPSHDAVELERAYRETLNIGCPERMEELYRYCYQGGKYEMKLMFIREPPFKVCGVTFFVLKEIGKGVFGDWHWLSLDQLVICDI